MPDVHASDAISQANVLSSGSTLVAPMGKIENDPYYEWVVKQRNKGRNVEDAKIEYLIERIRKSPVFL